MGVEQAPPQNAGTEQADIGFDKDQRAGDRRSEPCTARRRRQALAVQQADRGIDTAGFPHEHDQRANQQTKNQHPRIARIGQNLHGALGGHQRAEHRITARDQGF
jgi:hypothetical protein